jgi:Domain of unknown function (DUF4402)
MSFSDRIYMTHLQCRSILAGVVFLIIHLSLAAQEPPPRPITVTATGQALSFGAFSQGAVGGTVTITSVGSRSSTGDVVLLNLGYSFSTALYQIVANRGTVISLLNGPDVSLPGSNGGSMTLHIGNSSPASPFVTTVVPPIPTLLNVGGVLTVGSPLSNPPGSYNGSFNITFIQE